MDRNQLGSVAAVAGLLLAAGCTPNTVDGITQMPDGGGSGEEQARSCLVPTIAAGDPNIFTPFFGGFQTAGDPPPPISGGTLIALRDGKTAVAADADRDRVFVVDLSGPTVRASIALDLHDQPGRLAEDDAGLVHVALRGAGALVTIDPVAGKVVQRRDVCGSPRGVAYQSATDQVHVACAGGELVSFASRGATPARSLMLQPDLRDVVVDGSGLMVTRFRTAEVLVLDAKGKISEVIRLPAFSSTNVLDATQFEPAVAWRAARHPSGGLVMSHQRGTNGKVGGFNRRRNYYAGTPERPCDVIVHSAVSRVRAGERPWAGPALPNFTLPVDIAVSPDGLRFAMVAAGNGHTFDAEGIDRLFVTTLDQVTEEWSDGCGADGWHGPSLCQPIWNNNDGTCPMKLMNCHGYCVDPSRTSCEDVTPSTVPGSTPDSYENHPIPGCRMKMPTQVEPVAVAFAGETRVLVQTREPAELFIVTEASTSRLSLSAESRADSGHAIFHANSGGGLACASCHPEGHEDGRVWTFQCEGAVRTMDLSNGLRGSEPYHWNGDMPTFASLVENIFVGRMAGPPLTTDEITAMSRWLESVPPLPPPRAAADPAAVRGRILFESEGTACATCHSGPTLTNNKNESVGTGGKFQVPSLRGLARRPPYMHNGCARTLEGRFSDVACGGGEQHGKTAHLTPAELSDLVAYMESL